MPDGQNATPLEHAMGLPAPRATSFIVTIYGDVAEPRGGTLSMAALIATCAVHGISETLARTAVSRLVASGALEGARVGRRSFYRLTESARTEFRAAARLFYDPLPEAEGWLVALGPGGPPPGLSGAGWVRLAPDVLMGPDRSDLARPDSPIVAGSADGDTRTFAQAHWDLESAAAGYRDVLDRFGPAGATLSSGAVPDGGTCLALRLRLVHAYRQAVLADPRLPRSAQPIDWPGARAQQLFAQIYLALAAASDAHVGASFDAADGPLPAETPATRARLQSLERVRKTAVTR
ncbi:Transcriptional repressor PaaX [Roseivivax jejudonensis]|uniref:Transcriptional repressor PaaX n=1 Tax=Roseivivax jejudonensis TaxID=1529041 RepID=A0A1X6Z4L7_9RHOB|nr:PaaX family transcriptional regulator C-terminal domain-containing protein [Roseivivax jejudonensis]SLN40291.1 Transcriptional repressor PaaX [Roseivivax jejudonensis]